MLNTILNTFTTYGSRGRDQFWLWEGFKGEQAHAMLPEPLDPALLLQFVAPDERVWFVTEDWGGTKRDGHYWVFEGQTRAITQLLQELFAFEYYLVAKDFSWLLCENHHNTLIGVGPTMVSRVRAFESARQQNLQA
ncbi:DUF6756 family protein [Deinococcus malanensis]|uniref:DUF6756 family protein n=1 Tax=Deinococcus malanensis TaxID=1706855 RepID=UPI00362AB763